MHRALTALAALLAAATVSGQPCVLSERAWAFMELVSQRRGGVRTLGENRWRQQFGLEQAEIGFCEWEIRVERVHHHTVTMFVCKEHSVDCHPLFEDVDPHGGGQRVSSGCVFVPAKKVESVQDK